MQALRVLLVALVSLMAMAGGPARAQPQIELSDGSLLDGIADPTVFKRLPVLFVHGHGGDPAAAWRSSGPGLFPGISFEQTLNLQQNLDDLGLEPYYIRFTDQDRSILEDAGEIGEAVEIILNRHDPSYDLTLPPAQRKTHVQLAVIAYSKGTISTRLYLKSLQQQVPGLPAPRPDFRPVSSFIAIAPPNHGVPPIPGFLDDVNSTAEKQLHNGYDAGCQPHDSPAVPWVTDFFVSLNGYPLLNAANAPASQRAGEAPGLRTATDPPYTGTLYVTIYADGNRDVIGGDDVSADCQHRLRARNLADGAVNLELDEIPGAVTPALGEAVARGQRLLVHAYTVHDPEVICVALYTAVHNRPPPGSVTPTDLCTESGGVPIIPPLPRATVALALDFSGSMASAACPQTGCPLRHEVLKDAVELFIQLWTVVGAPRDHLAVATFRSAAGTLAVNGVELLPLLANAPAIGALVQGEMPGGLTAMGSGLETAIGLLPNAADARRVVLLTDGLQNVQPLVEDLGTHRQIGAQPGALRLDMLGFAVDTIAIGDGAFTDRLVQIAGDTGGVFETTLAPAQDLREYFVEELISSLRGFSPQLVAYRRGSTTGDATVETFAVNEGADKVILKLSWRRGAELELRVENGGRDVTKAGRMVRGPFYRIFVLDLPAELDRQPITAGGDWSMTITGDAGIGYEAAAIVDEPALSYRATVTSPDFRAGSPLDLELALFDGERPIAAGVEVTARVLTPATSVGTLLATQTTPQGALPALAEPGSSPGQRKLALLLQDEKHWQSLQPVAQSVTLRGSGDGHYRASFPGAVVAGGTRVIFTVEGEDPRLGRLQRSRTVSTKLRLGPLDAAGSGLTLAGGVPGAGGRSVTLQLRPIDLHGNYLGPDYAGHIGVALGDGAVAGAVADLGNGSYAVPLFVADGRDPDVGVTLAGAPLFSGKLSDLPPASGEAGPARHWVYLLAALLVATLLLLWVARRRRRS